MTAETAKTICRVLLDSLIKCMEPGEALAFSQWLVQEAHDSRDESETISMMAEVEPYWFGQFMADQPAKKRDRVREFQLARQVAESVKRGGLINERKETQ
jgi:hypothetical protein